MPCRAFAGIGLALWLAAGDARAATLPTVRCHVETGMDGLKFPTWPNRQAVDVPASLAPRLAVYVGGLQRASRRAAGSAASRRRSTAAT